MEKKKIIGRLECANFPSLGLNNLEVKIDTGAYTSSIHCRNIREISEKLYCNFSDHLYPIYNGKELVFDKYEMTNVKSSNGITQLRYQIITIIEFGQKEYPIELTLTDRAEMRYPVLIGRKFLTQKFIVDVSLINQLKATKKE